MSELNSSWTPVPLPFYSANIPGPLPTDDEIMMSSETLSQGFGRFVVVVREHFVAKHGPAVEEREGQNLLFLERMCNLPGIPRLYAMYRRSNGHWCIIMQHMPGCSLEKLWAQLKDTEKEEICQNTKQTVDAIRSIPGNVYGGLDGGPFRHQLFWSSNNDRPISGPFHTESQLNAAFAKNLQGISASNQRHSYKADFYKRWLDTELKDNVPVFTHADLQRKNILVLRTVDKLEVSIVDWEFAGWYPSYWEYAFTFATFAWNDDWPVWFEQILEPRITEGAIMRMIYQDIVF